MKCVFMSTAFFFSSTSIVVVVVPFIAAELIMYKVKLRTVSLASIHDEFCDL